MDDYFVVLRKGLHTCYMIRTALALLFSYDRVSVGVVLSDPADRVGGRLKLIFFSHLLNLPVSVLCFLFLRQQGFQSECRYTHTVRV